MHGKKAVITGAASGIGAACARELASAGAACVLLDANLDGAREVAAEIDATGRPAWAVNLDVRDAASVRNAFDTANRRLGGLDVAVNAAGIEGPLVRLHECDDADFAEVLDVNLSGVFRCLQQQVRYLRRGGSIVNVASVFGLQGSQGGSAYAASKHGVVGLTRSLALELKREAIRVNCVCPGPTETPMMQRIFDRNPALREPFLAAMPDGRLLDAAEVAREVAWLCSDDAAEVTGQAVEILGGSAPRRASQAEPPA